jgi:AraC-like DNA-binding protein
MDSAFKYISIATNYEQVGNESMYDKYKKTIELKEKGKVIEAKKEFDEIYSILETNFREQNLTIYELGYELYSEVKDYKKANKILIKKHTLELALNDLKRDSLGLAFEERATVYMDKLEILEEKNALKTQRLFLIIIALILLVLIITLFHVKTKKQHIQNQKYSSLENKALKKELMYNKWKTGMEDLGLQLKFPIQNSKLILDNLLQIKNYNDKTFKDLTFMLKANQTKLINSINSVISSVNNSNFYNYFELQPKQFIGLGFVNQLLEQIKILTGPNHIHVEMKHWFKKESLITLTDSRLEYILSEQIQQLINSVNTLTHLCITIYPFTENEENIDITICAQTPFSDLIDSMLKEDIEIETLSTSIKGKYNFEKKCIEYTISTLCSTKDLADNVEKIILKPTQISASILSSSKILLISNNPTINEIIVGIKSDLDIIKPENFNVDLFQSDSFDSIIFYSDKPEDYKLFTTTTSTDAPLLPTILILDYHGYLTTFPIPNSILEKTILLDTLNGSEILQSLLSIITDKQKDYRQKNTLETHLYAEEFVNQAVKLILKNIEDTDYKLKDLATDMFYSERQLQRIIKQKTGMPISKLILEVKLKEAFNILIQNPVIRVQEVQYMVGFKSSSHFSKAFKERFGFPPGQLRAV